MKNKVEKLWARNTYAENKNLPLRTLNKKFYCPVCGKYATYKEHDIVNDPTITVTCGCGIRDDIPQTQYFKGLLEYERGVTWNEENGVVSYYLLGSQFFEKKTKASSRKVIGVSFTSRVSINTRTGAAYRYINGVGNHMMFRIDWGSSENLGVGFSLDGEAGAEYFNAVLSKLDLPVAVKPEYTEFGEARYAFECGGHRNVVAARQALQFVSGLAVSPNMYIAYDGYKKTALLRTETLLTMMDDDVSWYTPEFKKAQPRRLMDEGEYISLMCSTFGLPSSPRMKMLYRNDTTRLAAAQFLVKAGFKRVDNLYRLLSEGFHEFRLDSSTNRKSFLPFLKAFVRSNGETTACNKLLASFEAYSGRSYFLNDVIRLWDNIKEYGKDISFTGTLKEIHDKASALYNSLRCENRAIGYTEKELSRCGTYGEYSITTAKDTLTLRNIGSAMHICVGSYGNLAVSKKTTIYYMTDREGIYAACIEVKGDKLCQAKGYCNGSLYGDAARAVRDWINACGLSVTGCSDYQYLLQNLRPEPPRRRNAA